MTTKYKLLHLLRCRLAKVGLTCDALRDASEIVVFGSHAAGVSTRSSDLDVLVVGSSERINRCGLDLISVSSNHVRTGEWLGSELASHIAAYGVWLRGRSEWKELTVHTRRSEAEKARRIKRLVRGLVKSWHNLHPIFHIRYRRSVRRELQRLHLLRQNLAIPPSAVLDAHWKRNRNCRPDVIGVTKSLKMSPTCFNFVLAEVFKLRLPSRQFHLTRSETRG